MRRLLGRLLGAILDFFITPADDGTDDLQLRDRPRDLG